MFLTILFLLVAIYCGAALGFLMMTYNIPSLKLARRIYIHVPYLTVKITISILLDLLEKRDFNLIIPVIKMHNKMTIVGLSMVKVASEYSAKHPKVSLVQAIKLFKYIKFQRREAKTLFLQSIYYTKRCIA